MRSTTLLLSLLAASSTSLGCMEVNVTGGSGAFGTVTVGVGGACDGAGGSGGTADGGAGGEAGPPPNDACPGAAYQLGYADSITVTGSTAQAIDDYQSFCGNPSGAPDVVYAITLEQEGTFKLSVTSADSSGLNPAIYIRTSCADDATTLACFDFGDDHEEIAGHFQPGVYFAIVDGSAATAGDFELTASLNAATCGDGVINPGEECDNGQAVPNDGCADPGDPLDLPCTFQNPGTEKDICPGEQYALTTAGLSLLASQGHHTTGFADDYGGSCGGAAGGRDRVYQIVPAVDGTMHVSVGYEPDGTTATCDLDITSPGCFDRVLYVRSSCGDQASELACSDVGAAEPESVTVSVFAGNSYFVFVDGYDSDPTSAGDYNLLIDLQ